MTNVFSRGLCLTRFSWLLLIAALAAWPTAAAQPPAELARWLERQDWRRDVAGPVVELGAEGAFDDQHIFAPAVAEEAGRFWLWYSGSRGTPGNRVFRLGLATGTDGRQFVKHTGNPVLEFADGAHSVLTPALLRSAAGHVLREEGKLRLWFAAARLGRSGLHQLHQSRSADGIQWDEPSGPLLDNAYCPSVLKTAKGYEMWFSDVSRRPWVIRHAVSADGEKWSVTPRPALVLSQPWEAEVLVYPTVLKVENAYLMWYGSYDHAIRRETTAIGFAVSVDGEQWFKHPQNPVLRPAPDRPWESNYVGSGCVLRLSDGSFRYWYASRKVPPFRNLYFAINTAHWAGPSAVAPPGLLKLPPQTGDIGLLAVDAAESRTLDLLEIVDDDDAIVRAWYIPVNGGGPGDATFVDLWIHGMDTHALSQSGRINFAHPLRVAGNRLIDTTCGQRSFVVLERAVP